jgi:hypothetical protein
VAKLSIGGRLDGPGGERTGDTLTVDTDELTTHGVIVGMTGSGKTGLGVVLIEEVLRAGIPALLVDPKGDLTNLCLTFPELAPEDFAPWVEPSQDASPVELATAAAAQWTEGLAGWGLGAADVAALRAAAPVTVYTPGSRSGVPVNLIGGLDAPGDTADAEDVADEIEGYVTGLLNLVGIAADPLASREHILLANLIDHAWSQGLGLDLPTLVSQVQQPPIRKLGVLDVDEFFPAKDRTALALKLNGLLASPSFAAWAEGPALDVQSLLYTPDGRPRCAVFTTAHLSDDERQFVTSLLLTKLVTWMRRQSGTTDLRALLYMDEVAGYLPPTANPPTKKPVMTLMKQARAFGVGVVLSTQNPVDVDYKAISNAGTWMIGRLQTEQDKQRLLDGMSAASGGVDTKQVGDTIAALGKRQFVLRRAKADAPDVFTTRWALSYLRGPMTREQIAVVMADQVAALSTAAPVAAATPPAVHGVAAPVTDGADVAAAPTAAPAATPAAPVAAGDESPVMPAVADGVAVRWVDVASPWLADVGGDERGQRLEAAVMARVHIRYRLAKADVTHDEEYETVLFPLDATVDAAAGYAVDYDDRDLRADAPPHARYRMTAAPLTKATFFKQIERDLVDHLARNEALEIPANESLKLYGRPDESPDDFAQRCLHAAGENADAEAAKLHDTYATKAARLRDQLATAEDRVAVLEAEAKAKRNAEVLSTAGSVLGGLLGGRKSVGSMLGAAGTAAGRRGRTAASQERVKAADNKAARLAEDLEDLEAELADKVADIAAKWESAAADVSSITVAPTKTNIKVVAMALAWIPVT